MATSAASIALQLQKLSNQATEKSFKYNTQEANTARTWQKQMSDTSHQREVKDLIAAGLNPVLSTGGQGAQSYTTSSATAQAADPTGAVGNVWSSQIGADATRQAAAASAAATRYAAAQQASAARYAASLQYQAQLEKFKVTREGYINQKEIAEKGYTTQKEVAEIQNKKSLFGLLSNSWAERNIKGITGIVKGTVKNADSFMKNKDNYLRDSSKAVTLNNLNFAGRRFVAKEIKKFGFNTFDQNAIKYYTYGVLGGNRSYQKKWFNYVDNNYKSKRRSWTSSRSTLR